MSVDRYVPTAYTYLAVNFYLYVYTPTCATHCTTSHIIFYSATIISSKFSHKRDLHKITFASHRYYTNN